MAICANFGEIRKWKEKTNCLGDNPEEPVSNAVELGNSPVDPKTDPVELVNNPEELGNNPEELVNNQEELGKPVNDPKKPMN